MQPLFQCVQVEVRRGVGDLIGHIHGFLVQYRHFQRERRHIPGEVLGIHLRPCLVIEEERIRGVDLGGAELFFLLGLCHAVFHLIQLFLRPGDINGRRRAGEVLFVQDTAVRKRQIRRRGLDFKGIGVDLIKGHIHRRGRNGLHVELFISVSGDSNGKGLCAGRGHVFHHSLCGQIVRLNVADFRAFALDLHRHIFYVIVDDAESVFFGRRSGDLHFQRHMVQRPGSRGVDGNGNDKPKDNGNRHRSNHHGRTAVIDPLKQRLVTSGLPVLL